MSYIGESRFFNNINNAPKRMGVLIRVNRKL